MDNQEYRKKSLQEFKVVKKYLNKYDITFWLMSGTLLGSFIDGKFLPEDRDIDIGTWTHNEDEICKMEEDLIKEGFLIKKRYDPVNNSEKNMITLKKNGMPIDLKIFRRNKNYAYRTMHRNPNRASTFIWNMINIIHFSKIIPENAPSNKKKILSYLSARIPTKAKDFIVSLLSLIWKGSGSTYGVVVFNKSYFEEISSGELYNTKFPIPKRTREYLKSEYGDSWNKHDPSGIGGIQKPSHIVINRK